MSICSLMPITSPLRVEQRAAGVAGVDGRVGLDAVGDRGAVGGLQVTVDRGDDAGGEREVEAERVADGDDCSPTATWRTIAERDRRELTGAWLGSILRSATSVDSSEPTMVAGTCVPSVSLSFLKTTTTELAVTPLSLTTWALVRMSPSGGDDEAGADALLLTGGLAPHVRGAGEGRDDLDHAVDVVLVDLLGVDSAADLVRRWLALDHGLVVVDVPPTRPVAKATASRRAAPTKPATMVVTNFFMPCCLSGLMPVGPDGTHGSKCDALQRAEAFVLTRAAMFYDLCTGGIWESPESLLRAS